tara:strand:+ start:12529 stop:20658 length:8130 start_codon:yes stop_codon:yes gene_type:complete
MAEFKISRLRFSWVGEWKDQQTYNKDEIVQYNGKAYVCLVPHISNGFYLDLGAIVPKWELMMTGQTWKGVWEQFTFYSLDNIVLFGGIVYKCNTQHLSGAVLDTDITKWDVYAESKTWQSEWTSSTTYGVGDIVQYGGTSYECVISHVSADTDLAGLEADYVGLDSTQVKWKISKEGVQWRGLYAVSNQDSSTIRYKLNDLVKYGPSVYKCIVGHAPSVDLNDFSTDTTLEETFDETKWELWVPGLDFDGVWNSNTVYQPGDIVLYGGYLYQSLNINNINNVPSFNSEDSTDDWELVTQAWDVTGEWAAESNYKVGNVVTYGGDLYVAIADSDNKIPGNYEIDVIYELDGSSGTTIKIDTVDSVDPKSITIGMIVIGEGFASGQSVQSVNTTGDVTTVTLTSAPDGAITDGAILTFVGTNYTYWELMIPGFSWEGKWAEGKLYNQDDVSYYRNATYKCIREHTSALVNRPDNDFAHSYWIIYAQHDQRNSLSVLGEMIVYENDAITPRSIGAASTVLKVVGDLPQWRETDFTPNLYYVAVNGIDAPNRGTTPDTPWRTIKYACETVAKGTRKANEKELLERNKEWIVQETFFWFLYQQNQNIAPFDTSVNFNNESTQRDMRFIIDGLVTDLSRGQNARAVSNILTYFDLESTNKFTNDTVAAQAVYYNAVIGQLFNNIEFALQNIAPGINYQLLEGHSPEVFQYFNNALTIEADTISQVQGLERIIREPLELGTPVNIPPANEGAYSTISLKSGTYEEELPIVIPARSALNGDELRGAAVKPANGVNTLCTRTFGDINQFIVGTTVNMKHNTPVQFVSLNPVDEISTIIGGSNIVQGITYYVIGDSITDTSFSVSATKDGPSVPLFTGIGYMYVYGGNALSDMFYVQNATGIRNMTVTGLLGTLTPQNEFETRRPSGGAYVSLDPGTGPDDTSAWIRERSPYIQNVTTFGKGCTGLKIDSTLHNGGNKSIVSNDFTQILSDGIGIWCKGGDSLTEAVSVFSYYNYAGYFAEDGGRIRATNGNSSYGTFGVVAEGFDDSEIPATGSANNRNNQASAQAVSALGAEAEILKIQFTHAGEGYYEQTTNMLRYSNNFLDSNFWTTDGNLNIIKAASTPFVNETAWKIEGITNLSESSYFYQSVPVSPQGGTYTNIAGENITGSGIDATFNVTVYSNRYVVQINTGGSGYVVGNQIKILGNTFGGQDGVNDIIITVDTLSITTILTIQHTGTVPTGSALHYTASIYAKKGTSQFFDMYTIFSGFSNRTSQIRFNFDTEEVTSTQQSDSGALPITTNAEFVEDGWYRLSFTFYDETAQNTNLEYRIYPRGIDGISGITNFYGSQLQIGELTFFLETVDNIPTSYANINVSGAGKNAFIVADELRSLGVYQTRVLESDAFQQGGIGYKFQTNNAQSGNTEFLTLAQSEVGTKAEYENMRLVISSGKGAGQYGIISRYTEETKKAQMLKESFDILEVVSSDSVNDRYELSPTSDFHTVYPGQKLNFIPTFYDINIESTSQDLIKVTGTEGDLSNIMFVTSTAQLAVGQRINFTTDSGSEEIFGGVISNFDYFIITITNETTIQISTTLGGGVWPLNTEDGSMTLNFPANNSYLYSATGTDDMEVGFPIQFTGRSLGNIELGVTHYIHEIYNANNFSISANLNLIDVTDTNATGNVLTIDDTSTIIPLNAIIFKGNTLGGLAEKTQYWINNIVDGTTFTLTSSIVAATATATQATTNLITVDSTAGFIAGSPIIFTGTTFGGLVNDKVYYIQVVNDATSLTISATPLGAAVALATATGNVVVRTSGNTVSVTTETGIMNSITPGEKLVVTAGGSVVMGASFNTERFGGIAEGTTYFVLEKFESFPTTNYAQSTNWLNDGNTKWDGNSLQIEFDTTPNTALLTALGELVPGDTIVVQDSTYGELEITLANDWFFTPAGGITTGFSTVQTSPFSSGLGGAPYDGAFTSIGIPISQIKNKQFTITDSEGGVTPVALESDTGSMQIAEVGFDHINAGTPLVSQFDSTTVYTIEPRVIFGKPGFLQETMGSLPLGQEVSAMGTNGSKAIAISKIGNQAAYTSDFTTWDTIITLPISGDDVEIGPTGPNLKYNGGFVDIAYGNGTWIILSATGTILYSVSEGVSWLTTSLPVLSTGIYSKMTYGNGVFIAIASDSQESAYSLDNGATWTLVSSATTGTYWIDIAYGNETFIALDGSGHHVKYSTDNGVTWTEQSIDMSLDSTSNNWSQIQYGNGRFVAISSDIRTSVYSFDGITWYESNLEVGGTLLQYGQGVFVVLDPNTGTCCQSEDGFTWRILPSVSSAYKAMTFTFDTVNNKGYFLTMSDSQAGIAYRITTGSRAQARVGITDTIITGVGLLQSGSGYISTPSISVIDPNNSQDAELQVRIGSGVLSSPTFVNYGAGYSTTSTAIAINGEGYADAFQVGLKIVCKNLTRLPQPGDNLQFEGNSEIYRVAKATILKGSVIPNLECLVQLSPSMSEELSPDHDTPLTIRSRFSQVRLTNHDFLNIGFGNELQSNYPFLPEVNRLEPQDEVQETNNGRVFYSSTDQDGNFRVGDLFAVEQATGIVTLSADEFGLSGLTELSIGGVALGGSPVVVKAFSTDGTFVANSNTLVPTQKAIKTYLASRLSQGGSDTFTGLLTAGTVKVGGPDEIASTVPDGAEGSSITIPTKAMFSGPFGNSGWAGDGLAMAYFMRTFVDPTRSGQQ